MPTNNGIRNSQPSERAKCIATRQRLSTSDTILFVIDLHAAAAEV
jgi:hypothetical protein